MSAMPTLFISHGAPTFALEPGAEGAQLAALGVQLPTPKAVLIVSPHWMTRGIAVASTAKPETIHDFGGFDPKLYTLQYPAPGSPEFAQQTIEVLQQAGFKAIADSAWGLDHGAWVPMMHLYPKAQIPVFQVSMPHDLTAQSAWKLGQALAPLRDAGLLIIGSGSLTHNLRDMKPLGSPDAPYALEFVQWVRDVVASGELARLQDTFEQAPHAHRAHPTIEHYLPLLVAAGAAPQGGEVKTLDGALRYSAVSMESYLFEA
jgi:4,5-DOPA dioxygenase extradiol